MTKRFRSFFVILLAGFAVAMGAAVHTQDNSGRFDMAVRTDFFAGFSGDMARFDKAMTLCETTLAANPRHAEALVWHGGGLIFRAGLAFQKGDFQTGGELWGKGMKEMEDAVALQPDHIAVRIPRAAVLIEASRNMPPQAAAPVLRLAVDDYERVRELQLSDLDKLSDHARGELLFALADGWARLGDKDKARAYFTQLTTGAATSGRTEYAKLWLEGKAPARAPACIGCHK
jgi:tetratricopeptide (TPR) repeat protein